MRRLGKKYLHNSLFLLTPDPCLLTPATAKKGFCSRILTVQLWKKNVSWNNIDKSGSGVNENHFFTKYFSRPLRFSTLFLLPGLRAQPSSVLEPRACIHRHFLAFIHDNKLNLEQTRLLCQLKRVIFVHDQHGCGQGISQGA